MKYLAVILFFVTLLDAKELIIEKQKEFQVELDPNLYTSRFSINMEEYDQNIIEDNFQKAIELAKDFKICKGGEYSINPHYKKRTFLGYVHFSCRFTDKEVYEELLDRMKKLKGKLSQNKIQLANNSEALDEARMKLEKMALVFPKYYTPFLQENLEAKSCFVDKIIFNSVSPGISPYMLRANAETVKTKVTVPIQEKIKHTLRTNYIFKCIHNN